MLDSTIYLLLFIGLFVGIIVVRMVIKSAFNSVGDAIRNSQIDKERNEGKANTQESLADRYNQGDSKEDVNKTEESK
jgi:hypothetical protein